MNMRWTDWLILALLGVPFFVALEDASLWGANEPYYVQTPREMLERGDWIVPYFNGQPRTNKPPLAYWLVGALYAIFGVDLFWERLLMALLAYSSVLLLYDMAREILSPRQALLAAGMLATTVRFLLLARRLLIDVLLLFCLLAALWALWRWYHRRRPPLLVASAFFLGLGFLAKGPVAFLPLLLLPPALLLSPALRRRLRRSPWPAALAVLLGVSCSWFLLLAWREGWEPVARFFVRENLARFSYRPFGPQRGPFYYLIVLAVDFFPWSFFLPSALLWAWRNRRRRRAPALKGAAAWVLLYLVLFSLALNKQEYYILPVYPLLALWLAPYLAGSQASRRAALAATLVLALLGGALLGALRLLLPDLPSLWLPFLPLALGLVFLGRGRIDLVPTWLALFYALFFLHFLAPLERYQPLPHFARSIRQEVARKQWGGYQVGYWGLAATALVFELNRPVQEVVSLPHALAFLESPRPSFLVVDQERFLLLQERVEAGEVEIVEVRPKLYTTGRNLIKGFTRGQLDDIRQVWTRPVYLLRNRP